MDTATSKSLGMDTAMSESPAMDTTTVRHGYNDASFLLHRILHQKVRNMENLHGKIRAFVLVAGCIIWFPMILMLSGKYFLDMLQSNFPITDMVDVGFFPQILELCSPIKFYIIPHSILNFLSFQFSCLGVHFFRAYVA